MSRISDSVKEAWSNRKGPVILTTVNEEGEPNAIYATCTELYGNDYVVVADNYFSKTRANILSGSKGSVLFMTNENKAYQLKGSIEYHKEGTVYDDMKCWNPEQHPGHGAAALKVEEIYSGAEKLL